MRKKPEIDLFDLRLSSQLPSYYSWKLDPNGIVTDALQQKWYHKSLYAFPPFALIHKVLKKVEEEKLLSLITVTPTNSNLANSKLLPRTLTFFSEKSNHFAIKGGLTKESSKPIASSYPKLNNSVSSVGCLRKHFAEEGIPERDSNLIVLPLCQLTHWSGISRLAGVLKKTWIQLDVI